MKKIIPIFAFILSLCFISSCGSKERDCDFSVHCFNTGAADCFLISDGDCHVMIDTAESSFGDEIVTYLKSNDINELDFLIITHFDKDHVGGAPKVIKNIPVKRALQSNYTKDDSKKYSKYLKELEKSGIVPETVRNNSSFDCGNVHFTVYPPEKEEYKKSLSNNSSLIVSMQYGDTKFLFCGDAEEERLSEFISQNTEDFDFIKMPHHGRIGKNTGALLTSVKAEYAVITSSDDEPESNQVLNLLEENGTEVFLTRNGDIDVSSDGNNVTVTYSEK